MKKLTFDICDTTRRQLESDAKNSERSVSAQIRYILDKYYGGGD